MSPRIFALLDGTPGGLSCGHCRADLTEPAAVDARKGPVAESLGREMARNLALLEADGGSVWSAGEMRDIRDVAPAGPVPVRAESGYAFCSYCGAALLERRS